jgi:small subunit ribosomal protein S9
MADDETPETPDAPEQSAEAPTEQHAVPSEDAKEIAGSAEDAALEAAEEKRDAPAEHPAPEAASAEPAGEGHAVPSSDAAEIAGSAEDAALEALQESEDAVAVEAAIDEEEDEGDDADVAASSAKPAVPGAHLEVDIVPEGADPLGRGESTYEDPYAIEGEDGDSATQADGEAGDGDETLSEPIATAAIDLAAGARYRATGKRKTAIARVTLRPGKGTYVINGRTLEQHFPRDTLRRNIRQPLETVGYQDKMDVIARLHGGGVSAQAGALRHGVSRALLEADPNLRGELKRRGFLTRDSRAKERKKAGLKKARKKPQFSKR